MPGGSLAQDATPPRRQHESATRVLRQTQTSTESSAAPETSEPREPVRPALADAITTESRPNLIDDTGTVRATGSIPVPSSDWRRFYARGLIVTDSIIVVLSVVGSFIFWGTVAQVDATFSGRSFDVPSYLLALGMIVIWVALLTFYATRDQRYLGSGPLEYRAVVDASVRLLLLVVLVAFVFKLDLGRGPVFSSFIFGVAFLILGRWLWRRWLWSQRAKGRLYSRVLVVGGPKTATELVEDFRRARGSGFAVVGVCLPTIEDFEAAPVLGNFDHIEEVMASNDIDTVAFAASGELTAQRVREISWQLEPGKHHLIVAPSITDIGGPRIHMRPVAGMALLHVETPRFERGQRAVKRTFDIMLSAILLVLLSPVLLAIAIAVKCSSPGPILFRQQRVGRDGRIFTMLKFRSMVADAEDQLKSLLDVDREEGNEILFKMRDDPRVTKVGRFIRRFSLDELPQLWNALVGDMSLIGPRPPLPSEVEQYDDFEHRRFLMKPGLTGLWQVSGRSNLSWDESVRLDLYYVDNWSLMGDIVILWKTIRAVLAREGAY